MNKHHLEQSIEPKDPIYPFDDDLNENPEIEPPRKKSLLPTIGLAVCGVFVAIPVISILASGTIELGDDGATTRLGLIALACSVGFGLGWLLSPSVQPARQMMFLAVLVLGAMFSAFASGAPAWIAAVFLSLVGFCGALGFWLRNGLQALGETPNTFGSSRWATMDDLKDNDLLGNDGIRIGTYGSSEPISYHGDRHLLTVAPTRSGKGTTQIIPNLLTHTGSVLVIDPKGENAMVTAKHRKDMGQDVHVIAPWGMPPVEGINVSRFNPLDWLDKGDIDVAENAMILANAIVMENGHGDPFWSHEAKALLQGLLLHVATSPDEDGNRTLARVRELLLLGPNDMIDLFKVMAGSPHPIVASTGNRCLQKEEKLLSSVVASAQAETNFLDSARLRDSMMVSDFRFEDLKSKPMTIYLVLPTDRLETFGRWLRLLVQQAITVNARNIEAQPDKPVLFILDEFAALGKLSMVEQAYGLMAGFGMQLWAIIQDFSQLERIYDKGWQSFIANAGMINYFGSTDEKTPTYFSTLCGETTVWNFSTAIANTLGSSSGGRGGSTSESLSQTDTQAAGQRKLAYPDELMRLPKDKQLVFIENVHPIIANKNRWFEDDELKVLGVNLHD